MKSRGKGRRGGKRPEPAAVPGMSLRLLSRRGTAVFGIEGRIPPGQVSAAAEMLREVIARGYLRIVGDLRRAEEISPGGVGVWLYYLERLRHQGGLVVLVRPREPVMGRLRALGAESVFAFTDSLKEALALASAPATAPARRPRSPRLNAAGRGSRRPS